MQVLSGLEAGSDTALREIADAAQHFAYRHLSQQAKALYVRRALQIYNGLFSGGTMERFVGRLEATHMSSIDSFMTALRAGPA